VVAETYSALGKDTEFMDAMRIAEDGIRKSRVGGVYYRQTYAPLFARFFKK
jgi:hypothetical protein